MGCSAQGPRDGGDIKVGKDARKAMDGFAMPCNNKNPSCRVFKPCFLVLFQLGKHLKQRGKREKCPKN